MRRQLALAAAFLLLGWGFWISPEFKSIAAGVAIFLFGMLSLEEGFKAFTGGTLERILQRSTDRLWKSVVFGIVSTTVMQSSTLVSVITISFLSAGLLGLAQGIGIIFGANLGTTTGAWLIAGFGLKVDIAAYAMPMLTFGVILILNRSATAKGLGHVLAGMGFLFLGIHYLVLGFETAKETLDLAAFAMTGIAGLLVFTLIGIVATIVIQSSHATLVLIITALAAGQISYENALALAIGANVGTTFSAILSALSANIAGRRVAAAHFIFNVSTGLVALAFIHPIGIAVDTGADWLGIAEDDYTLKLALFHTLFNLIGVALMLPLTDRLVQALETWLKPAPRKVSMPHFINDTMLAMPDAGLEAARKEVLHLFANGFDIMALVLHAEPARLRRAEGLELLVNPPERIHAIDVDELYQQRVKPLHASILAFLVRLRSDDAHARQAFQLRSAAQDLVEALKALKHLQKNLVRYLASPNPYLRKEYVELRRRLALLLSALNKLCADPGESGLLALDVLAAGQARQDIVASGVLDQLIREDRIDAETATSLMNDNDYANTMVRNLLDMARGILTPLEHTRLELEQALQLDRSELRSVATNQASNATEEGGLR